MKRIEFIEPVSAMRGNMSGVQNLVYPTQDNKAYDGPVGNVNYARNYTPRYIGNKRASDGHKYFSVKTKSANHLTSASKKAMALLGAAGAMYASLVRNKTATVYVNIREQWIALQALGMTDTFRKYVTKNFRTMLSNKQASIVFAGPKSPVTVQNPWVSTATLNVPVNQLVLVKFWGELAPNQSFYFYVENEKGVSKYNMDFADLTVSSINVLNLTMKSIGSDSYVGRGSGEDFTYMLDAEGEYMLDGDIITEQVYKWTTVAP